MPVIVIIIMIKMVFNRLTFKSGLKSQHIFLIEYTVFCVLTNPFVSGRWGVRRKVEVL